MSRIASVLLVAALLSMAPGLALGADEQEQSREAPAAQSQEVASCAARSEATPSGKTGTCPARSQAASPEKPETQDMPIYVPPQRGAPSARIGGSTRGI